MAISTNRRTDKYTCNGTGPYAITFPVELDDSSDAKNIKVRIDSGADLDSSKYTVTGLNVSTVDSYDNTHTITIYRATPPLQGIDYLSGGGEFDLETLEEDGLDHLIRLMQELHDDLKRVPLAPITDPDEDHELPSKEDRKGYFAAWDLDGVLIPSAGPTDGVIVSPFMETVLDDLTAAAARVTLGVKTEAETDHDNLLNTHNLTTDIDHDQLTNFAADEHRKIYFSVTEPGGISNYDLWFKPVS